MGFGRYPRYFSEFLKISQSSKPSMGISQDELFKSEGISTPKNFFIHSMSSTLQDDEEFIARCPTSSFRSPSEVNKPIAIKPLKRQRENEEEDNSRSVSPTGSDHAGVLNPRKLNFDDEKVESKLFQEEDDEEEEEEVEKTQPFTQEPEVEEGEIPPSKSEQKEKD